MNTDEKQAISRNMMRRYKVDKNYEDVENLWNDGEKVKSRLYGKSEKDDEYRWKISQSVIQHRQHCRLPILESKSKLQWDEYACLIQHGEKKDRKIERR